MTARSRVRSIGWIVLLAICTGLYFMLHIKVQAVNSDVVRAERRIVALEQEKLLLETEFETRSNQRQLAAWNRVDFGYMAPTAAQFLDGEQRLAALGTPRALTAPEPILVARADLADELPAFADLVAQAPDEAIHVADRRVADRGATDDALDTGRVLVAAALNHARIGPPFSEAGLNEATRIPLAAMVRAAAE